MNDGIDLSGQNNEYVIKALERVSCLKKDVRRKKLSGGSHQWVPFHSLSCTLIARSGCTLAKSEQPSVGALSLIELIFDCPLVEREQPSMDPLSLTDLRLLLK